MYFLTHLVFICSLASMSFAKPTCNFKSGDGTGGPDASETRESAMYPDECIKYCLQKRKTNPTLNGVTVGTTMVVVGYFPTNLKDCFCEYNMEKINDNARYKTCMFEFSVKPEPSAETNNKPGAETTKKPGAETTNKPDSTVTCNLQTGMGQGSKERSQGAEMTLYKCIERCKGMRLDQDNNINGITFGITGKTRNRCYCEDNMNSRDTSTDYKSCYLEFNYQSLGCWNADSADPIATLEGIAINLVGEPEKRKLATEQCYLAALAKGYNYFAIQNDGFCASSKDAGLDYTKYGSSNLCSRNGKGGKEQYSVYEIKDLEIYGSTKDIFACYKKAKYTCKNGKEDVVTEISNCRVPNVDDCGLVCCNTTGCVGFSFDPVKMLCRLTSSAFGKTPAGDNEGLTTCIQIPVIGQWSEWGQWSACSTPCNKPRTRTRTCSNPPPKPGFICDGEKQETLVGITCDEEKISGIQTSFSDAIIGAYQGVNDGSQKWSTLHQTISAQSILLNNCLHESYTLLSYCGMETASAKYCKLHDSYTSVLYMLTRLPQRRSILTDINHNEALKTEAFKSFQSQMTLSLEEVKQKLTDVDKSFRKDFGNYLSQIAEYDYQIASQDKVYIFNIINSYQLKIDSLNTEITKMLTDVIGVMIGKAAADTITYGVKLAATVGLSVNPLSWIFGSADPGDIEERLADVANGVNSAIKAGTLFAKLNDIIKSAKAIQVGLDKNSKLHIDFFNLIELKTETINDADIKKVALEFTDSYGAFSPAPGLKKEDLIKFTSTLGSMLDTACDEISDSKTAAGNTFALGLFSAGYCQGTKIGPLIEELNGVFEESFDAQFEIMDVGAALARSLISKGLADKVKNVMEVGQPSMLDYVLGIAASATYRREVIYAACDAFEYRNFGKVNELCTKLKDEPMSNDITTLSNWVDIANQLNCDTKHRHIKIPAYSGATEKGYINLDDLYNGKVEFKIPDAAYARKSNWILKGDSGKAVYVQQFMLFLPPGVNTTEREDEIAIIFGGPNVLNGRTFYLPPNEMVSSYTYNPTGSCDSIGSEPYSHPYCPSPFSSKTCAVRFGETHAKYLPSLYGQWSIYLMNNQKDSQIQLERLIKPNVKGTIYLQALVKTCSNSIRSGGGYIAEVLKETSGNIIPSNEGLSQDLLQERDETECCGTKDMSDTFSKGIGEQCKPCPAYSVPSLHGYYCKELYSPLGCWVDKGDSRAIATLEGKDNVTLDGEYWKRRDAINKCYKAALAQGYDYFALQAGGSCASSSTAGKTYTKYGSSTSCEADGEGGQGANAVYKIISKSYYPVGCWNDNTKDPAIPTLEGKDKVNLDGSYASRVDAIQKCYKAAVAKGFQYFALQGGGRCDSSSTAGNTYKKHGSSDRCNDNGKGGDNANAVYKIAE